MRNTNTNANTNGNTNGSGTNTNNRLNNTLLDFFSVLADDVLPREFKNGLSSGLSSGLASSLSGSSFSPLYTTSTTSSNLDIRVDVQETDNMIKIIAELPGVDKKDIKIDFYNNQIQIKAEKIKPSGTFITNELKYGSFERKLTLPICVTVQKTVSTTWENGVLTIIIDKLVEESNRFSLSVD